MCEYMILVHLSISSMRKSNSKAIGGIMSESSHDTKLSGALSCVNHYSSLSSLVWASFKIKVGAVTCGKASNWSWNTKASECHVGGEIGGGGVGSESAMSGVIHLPS